MLSLVSCSWGSEEAVETRTWADLSHLGMNVETRVAQLRYLLGQQLHPLRRVTEDYRLVDLELSGERGNRL